MVLEKDDNAFIVRSGGMRYSVPRDGSGLLKDVRDGRKDHQRGPLTLALLDRAGKAHPLSPGNVQVTRAGPLACAFRAVAEAILGQARVAVVIEWIFPRSKSWV